jgi:hypothetical protein
MTDSAGAMFKWPPAVTMRFYDGRGVLWAQSSSRELDLADTLMLSWPHESRTVYMGVTTGSARWLSWDQKNVEKIEELIRYDITFDSY